MSYNEWLYKACEIKANRARKDITDIFSTVEIGDSKLYFLDGLTPEQYSRLI